MNADDNSHHPMLLVFTVKVVAALHIGARVTIGLSSVFIRSISTGREYRNIYMIEDIKRRRRTQPTKVNMGRFRLERHNYDALQRWMGYNKIKLQPAMNLAIESLPGIQPLIQEEKEAYATTKHNEEQRNESTRKTIDIAVRDA
jgi:hypothetical protein